MGGGGKRLQPPFGNTHGKLRIFGIEEKRSSFLAVVYRACCGLCYKKLWLTAVSVRDGEMEGGGSLIWRGNWASQRT